MRKFLRLLYERRDYFALLLAVILSLYFLFSHESPEIQILRAKASTVFTILYSPVMWVKGIKELRQENELLREKVMQLALLNSSFLHNEYENERLRSMLEYKRSSARDLVPARITSKGISPLVSSVTIDVGANHGISPDCAVLSVEGLVGRTITVAKQTSLVQIMTDYNFRASVKLEESGTVGILRWKDRNVFEVWEIPKSAQVRVGERIVTSGYSDIFPENLPVGVVTGVIDKTEMLHKIIVAKAYTDFSSLQHVFVVKKKTP